MKSFDVLYMCTLFSSTLDLPIHDLEHETHNRSPLIRRETHQGRTTNLIRLRMARKKMTSIARNASLLKLLFVLFKLKDRVTIHLRPLGRGESAFTGTNDSPPPRISA